MAAYWIAHINRSNLSLPYGKKVQFITKVTLPLGSRAAMRVGSSPFRRTKKKDMTNGHVFLFGFRPPEAASTLRDFNARGGKAAPAPRPRRAGSVKYFSQNGLQALA